MVNFVKIQLILAFGISCFLPQVLYSGEIDSLEMLLAETHNATNKIEIYTLLSVRNKRVDISKAYNYAHEALKLSERTGNTEYLREIYGLLGDVAVVHDSLGLAKEYYLKAMSILETQDDKSEMTGFLLVMGNIAFVKDNLAEALNYYHKGVRNAEEYGQGDFLDDLYLNIGSINFRIQNNHRAQEYYSKALDSFIQYGDSLEMADAYSNLGLTYVELGNYTTAEEYFNKALEIYRSHNEYTKSAGTYLSLSVAEDSRNNYAEVNNYLLLALDFMGRKDAAHQGPRQFLMASIYEGLGTNYIKLEDYEKAYSYLLKGHDLGIASGQIRVVSRSALGLSKFWDANGRIDSAFYYHKLHKAYSDSLNTVENSRNMGYQNARFEYNQLLVEEQLIREKQTEKQKRNRLIFIFIIAGLIMLLVVLILVIQLGRSKVKRIELEQVSLKKELDLRNKELTTHVIHQVKNNEFILNLSKKLKVALSNILPENRKQVNDVIREIEQDSTKETWKEFELRFQNVHTNFYKNLSQKYPDLTANELRVCAFLKLNMSTKDIAAITYQTTNSITVARWRLRQKFGMEKDENLVSFLTKF